MIEECELTSLLPNEGINLSGSGENTRITYMYRDGDNYKTTGQALFDGRISETQVRKVIDHLDGRLYFIPGQIDLQDLQSQFNGGQAEWDDDRDHPWHELTGISYTTTLPEVSRHIGEFVDQVLATAWDDTHLPDEYEAMVERHEKRLVAEDLESQK